MEVPRAPRPVVSATGPSTRQGLRACKGCGAVLGPGPDWHYSTCSRCYRERAQQEAMHNTHRHAEQAMPPGVGTHGGMEGLSQPVGSQQRLMTVPSQQLATNQNAAAQVNWPQCISCLKPIFIRGEMPKTAIICVSCHQSSKKFANIRSMSGPIIRFGRKPAPQPEVGEARPKGVMARVSTQAASASRHTSHSPTTPREPSKLYRVAPSQLPTPPRPVPRISSASRAAPKVLPPQARAQLLLRGRPIATADIPQRIALARNGGGELVPAGTKAVDHEVSVNKDKARPCSRPGCPNVLSEEDGASKLAMCINCVSVGFSWDSDSSTIVSSTPKDREGADQANGDVCIRGGSQASNHDAQDDDEIVCLGMSTSPRTTAPGSQEASISKRRRTSDEGTSMAEPVTISGKRRRMNASSPSAVSNAAVFCPPPPRPARRTGLPPARPISSQHPPESAKTSIHAPLHNVCETSGCRGYVPSESRWPRCPSCSLMRWRKRLRNDEETADLPEKKAKVEPHATVTRDKLDEAPKADASSLSGPMDAQSSDSPAASSEAQPEQDVEQSNAHAKPAVQPVEMSREPHEQKSSPAMPSPSNSPPSNASVKHSITLPESNNDILLSDVALPATRHASPELSAKLPRPSSVPSLSISTIPTPASIIQAAHGMVYMSDEVAAPPAGGIDPRTTLLAPQYRQLVEGNVSLARKSPRKSSSPRIALPSDTNPTGDPTSHADPVDLNDWLNLDAMESAGNIQSELNRLEGTQELVNERLEDEGPARAHLREDPGPVGTEKGEAGSGAAGCTLSEVQPAAMVEQGLCEPIPADCLGAGTALGQVSAPASSAPSGLGTLEESTPAPQPEGLVVKNPSPRLSADPMLSSPLVVNQTMPQSVHDELQGTPSYVVDIPSSDAADGVVTGWDSELTDLSESGDSDGASEVNSSSDEEPLAFGLKLKIRIPSMKSLGDLRIGDRRCKLPKCNQILPEHYKWKLCSSCRRHHREYQRQRLHQHGYSGAVGAAGMSEAALEEERRDLAIVNTKDHPRASADSPIPPDMRICSIRMCRNLIPSESRYRWKMCQPCRARTRLQSRRRRFERAPQPEPEDRQLFVSTTPRIRCATDQCTVLVHPLSKHRHCEDCRAHGISSDPGQDGHVSPPRSTITIAPKRRPILLRSMPQDHFLLFQHSGKLLETLDIRLSSFIQAQGLYLMYKQENESGGNGQGLDHPTIFSFDGEYSIVAARDDNVQMRSTRGDAVCEQIKDRLGINFQSSGSYALGSGAVIKRFGCVLDHVPLPASGNAISKRLAGELEITISQDLSHLYWPGQRIVVRLRFVG